MRRRTGVPEDVVGFCEVAALTDSAKISLDVSLPSGVLRNCSSLSPIRCFCLDDPLSASCAWCVAYREPAARTSMLAIGVCWSVGASGELVIDLLDGCR